MESRASGALVGNLESWLAGLEGMLLLHQESHSRWMPCLQPLQAPAFTCSPHPQHTHTRLKHTKKVQFHSWSYIGISIGLFLTLGFGEEPRTVNKLGKCVSSGCITSPASGLLKTSQDELFQCAATCENHTHESSQYSDQLWTWELGIK